MPTFTGIVALPPSRNVPTFNSPNYNQATQSLTYGDAVKSFLAFPQAQGKEQLLDTDVSGLLQCFGDISIIGAGNYIQFPDTSKQTTAFVEANYAQLNEDNIFLSPQINTFQGNSNPNGTTAPFRIGGANGEYASLYVDSSPTFDATLYSNQVGGGLTLRNVEGNSFTMTPSAPNNTAVFSNPISCGTFSLTGGAITGTQLTLSSSGNTTTLSPTIAGLSIDDPLILTGGLTLTSGADTTILSTQSTGLNISDPILVSGSITLSSGVNTSVLSTTTNGLNVADPIVATGNITAPGFGISDGVNNNYLLYSQNTYGMVIANTSGNNGTLTLSNGSTTLTTLSSTTDGLTINDAIILPSQTAYNPSTTYTNIASTQAFVQSAITQQGGGDASLSANQTFTGINTFSSTAQTSALQTFPQLSTNQFATYAYVNNIGESAGFNFLKLTCPQLTGSFSISYQTQGGPLNDSGQTKYNINTSVSGSVYTYLETWRYCFVSQSNLSPINNCIFTLSFSTGTTPLTSNENVSIRVVNGGTQYTLPCVLINNNTQFQTTTPLDIVSSQSYAFYLQGSYI